MKTVNVRGKGKTPQHTVKSGKPVKPAKTVGEKRVVPKLGSMKANWYFVLFFFVFSFILYGNTILNKYAIDDNYVTNNELVKKGLKALPEIFSTRYFTQQGNIASSTSDYRPIVKATFALEYQLWGEKPGRSHAVNVLIYWCISMLLFFLLRRIFKNFNLLFPFLVTLVFMAHPVHTEVVASLKNRDEMLAFLAGLGSLWFILNYAEKKNAFHLLIALLIFMAGYLSKSSILPFVLLYPLVLYFFSDLPAKRYLLVFVLMIIAVAIAQFGPKMFLPPVQRANYFIENPLYFDKNLWVRIGTGLITLLFYLRLMVFPYPLRYYYGYDMIPVAGPGNIWAILSLVIFVALLIYSFRNFRKKNILSFAILWFLVSLAMYSNVVFPVVGIVGERFAFTASLGFAIGLVYLVFLLFRSDPKHLTIEMDARLKILTLVVFLLVPYTAYTMMRNRNWRNLFDLYNNDVRNLRNSAKANIDYAGYLMKSVYDDENFLRYGAVNQLKYKFITSHFRRSLEIWPDNYQTTNDLGTTYLFIGKDYDSAVYYLKKAIAIDSTLQPAWVNLGLAYRQQKKYPEAIACYERILKINPNQLKAVFALADVYNDMGDFDRAVKMNEDVAKAYPRLEMPWVNIGNYYMLRTDTMMAVNYWERAAAINPSYELCLQLNSLYIIRGDKAKADYYYDLGIEILNRNR